MSSSVRNDYWTYSHKGRRALLRDTFKWALQLILMMKIMIMKMIILMKVMKENNVLHALRAFRLRCEMFPFFHFGLKSVTQYPPTDRVPILPFICLDKAFLSIKSFFTQLEQFHNVFIWQLPFNISQRVSRGCRPFQLLTSGGNGFPMGTSHMSICHINLNLPWQT